jgi:hypothetical protein
LRLNAIVDAVSSEGGFGEGSGDLMASVLMVVALAAAISALLGIRCSGELGLGESLGRSIV